MVTSAGTVASIMNPKLLYIRDGDRVSLARAQVAKFGVTSVPVLDDQHRPIGVVSWRDLEQDDSDLRTSTPAVTVAANATIEEAAKKLAAAAVHQLVVVDSDGVAVGMVSAIDFVRAMAGLDPSHPRAFAQF